jgi:hypothetical protein
MIAVGPRALRVWELAEKNPFLPLLPFSLGELIAEVIQDSIPDLPIRTVPCWFITTQSLAFITPDCSRISAGKRGAPDRASLRFGSE